MPDDRSEKLLAMILLNQMGGASQGQKADALARAGMSHAEIAEFLGTSAAVVRQTLYLARSGAKRSGKKASRK